MLIRGAGRSGPAAARASRRALVGEDSATRRARPAGGAARAHRGRVADIAQATSARTRGGPADAGTIETARADGALALASARAGSAGGAAVCPACVAANAEVSAASTGRQ